MSEAWRTNATLTRPILIALVAFFVCSAIVLTISALIEALSNGVWSLPESIHHTGCTLTDALGGWVRLSCDAGPLSGMLEQVHGDADALGAAIQAFVEFHEMPLTCETRGQALKCLAGDVALNDHLMRHGFGPPAMVEARIQREAWLATLLGFAGAIVAFLHEQRRERAARDSKERDARVKRERDIDAVRIIAGEVKTKLQQAINAKLKPATSKAKVNTAEELSEAIDAGRELAKELSSVSLPSQRVRELQTFLNEIESVNSESNFVDIMSRINGQFTSIDKDLRVRRNE